MQKRGLKSCRWTKVDQTLFVSKLFQMRSKITAVAQGNRSPGSQRCLYFSSRIRVLFRRQGGVLSASQCRDVYLRAVTHRRASYLWTGWYRLFSPGERGDSGAISEALHPALASVNILPLIGEKEEGPRWSTSSAARYSQQGRSGWRGGCRAGSSGWFSQEGLLVIAVMRVALRWRFPQPAGCLLPWHGGGWVEDLNARCHRGGQSRWACWHCWAGGCVYLLNALRYNVE